MLETKFDENIAEVRRQIRAWLDEDIGFGDITTMSTVPDQHQSKGIIHVKDEGILAGLPVAELVFDVVDPEVKFEAKVKEGQYINYGTVIAEVTGSSSSILMGERLALNLMQRMSGIATKTHSFVQAMEGLPVRLADTRKMTPGHRILEKYAVRIGGGFNHRFGLFDAVLIKDNHIKAAGGVAEAIRAAKHRVSHTMKVEIEVENKEQLAIAIQEKADIILLDNMSLEAMREAVQQIKSQAPHIIVEASGGVTLERMKEIAQAGVDVISVGSLTYSFRSLDISLDLNEQKGARI